MTVVTFSLFGFATLRKRLWAFSQMGLAKPGLRKIPDLRFFKLMGTGSGAGFSTRPNFGVYTLLAEWPSMEIARERIASSAGLERHRCTADRMATLYLEPVTSRGHWNGYRFEVAADVAAQRLPVVALTRAAIRPSKLFRFWSHVPAISGTVEREGMRRFMIGTGEIPWLHQVTVSLWQSAEAMERFARESATHGKAVRLAYHERWFSEYCFTRFNLLAVEGDWQGLTDMSGQERDVIGAGEERVRSGTLGKAARSAAAG